MGFLKNCERSAYYHPPSVACVSQRCRSCQVLNTCIRRGLCIHTNCTKLPDQLVPAALVEAETRVQRDMRHLCKHSECSCMLRRRR